MKTKLQIIDETVAYYSEDPKSRRALNWKNDCCYILPDGRMCAVGRCLIDPSSAPDDATVDELTDLDDKLKPEYRGHSVEFWSALQWFHDKTSNWVDTGINGIGQSALEELKERYA